MINNVVLVGRLTRAVDLRYTSNGVAFANFTVAVERTFKKENGERETDFINCVIWRKAAENFAEFTRKGSLVGIEGRIQTRSYDNLQGGKVYVTEVLAENFSLLESRNVTEQRIDSHSEVYKQDDISTKTFNKNQNSLGNFSNNDPFKIEGDVFNVQDDDLPF